MFQSRRENVLLWLLTCFEYHENGKPAVRISYRFILTDKQWDKMRDGTIEEPFGYKVRIE